ncbi:hypothetical protein LOTGIDRAFT_228960 [Lottia gigantea]|uniref:Uncharacterized protein n=1 Tax=Lottia gigantea TaxID=225164 RepID=V3ZD37_LOTGI|nr:hypothetical protein LOTGIDRAFT_228960 [Lottia gigantea]ESO89018.1 hypothetical protein LOTGIDRAFT_228960 [Lottia gigantea]
MHITWNRLDIELRESCARNFAFDHFDIFFELHEGVCFFFITVISGTYQGCYEENKRRRYMDVNPGDFDPTGLTIEDCSAKCGIFGYAYSGVTGGNFCFCSDTQPPPEALRPDLDCNIQCTGRAADTCGSKNHIQVYQSSKPVVGLKVDVSTTPAVGSTFLSGAAVDFDLSIEDGIGIYYQFDYDDGSGRTPKNATSMSQYTFNTPGVYSINVYGSDSANTIPEGQAVTTVVVEDPVGPVSITCPPLCATFEYCLCDVEVYKGNNMELLQTIDSVPGTYFKIADPIYDTVGIGVPTKGPTDPNPTGPGYFVLEHAEFRMTGKIAGFNIFADPGGPLTIHIFEPNCATGIYCSETNTCQASCSNFDVDCSLGEFCPSTRTCTATCTNAPRYTTGNLKIGRTIKQTVEITVAAGYNYIDAPSDMFVAPGDVLGFQQNVNAVVSVSRETSTAPIEDYFFNADPPYTAGAKTAEPKNLLLNAVMTAPSKVLLHHEFQTANTYDIKVDVRSSKTTTPVFNSTTVNVIEGINSTDIVSPIYAAVGSSIDFNLQPHSGSDYYYTWNFDDGTEENATTLPVSHSFTYAGVFNVTCSTQNALSQKSNFTEVVIEHTITAITLNTVTSSRVNPVNLNFTMATGSNFTCEWDYGDGTASETKDDADTPPGGEVTPVPHTYAAEGSYTVNVTCYNNISKMTKIATQVIESPITNLQILTTGASKNEPFKIEFQIDQGTNPTVDFTFDGVPFTKDATTNGFSEVTATAPAKRWETTLIPGKPTAEYNLTIIVSNLLNGVPKSIAFIVEVGMKNVVSTVSQTTVPTAGDVVFTLDMEEGSSVEYSIDFDDGSFSNFSLSAGADWANEVPRMKSVTHQFADGRVYNVKVTAWNSAGTETFSHTVTAIQSVLGIQMNNEDYYRFTPPAYPHFNFTAPGSPPNQAKAFFDFGDNKEEEYDLTIGYNYYHEYRDIGRYFVTANVSNSISAIVLTTNITIVEILQDLIVKSVPPGAAAIGENLVLDVSLYRGPTGQDCTIDVDYGDAPVMNINGHIRTGQGQFGTDRFETATYSTVGPRTVTVTVTTPLEQLVETYSVEVQDKVLPGFTVTMNPTSGDVTHNNNLDMTINYPFTPLPTDASYSISYGDGTFQNGSLTGTPTTIPSHVFATDGQFQGTVTIYNLASTETINLNVGSYIPVAAFTVATSYKKALPLNAPEEPGLGTPGSFPRDRPVIFRMSPNSGTVTEYAISYQLTAGGTITTLTKTTNPFTIDFPASGSFDVTITAKNPLTSSSTPVTVIILDRVVNTSLVDASPRAGPGESKTFNLSFAIQGDMTCLLVDFGDGVRQTWADDPTYCNVFTPPVPTHVSSLTGLATIDHIYNSNGFYDVMAEAKNGFSSSSVTINAPVSTAKCTKPTVNIQDQSYQFYSPQISNKGSDLRVLGKSDIFCATTLNNKKNWKVETVDDNTGLVNGPVDINSLATRANAEFYIPARFLDYGLYKFTYSMEMISDQFNGGRYVSTTYTYLRIQKSDLVGIVERGGISEVKRGQGTTAELKPADYSYDPDDSTPIGSQTFNSFTWTCEPVNENATTGYCDLLLPAVNRDDSPLVIDLSQSPSQADYKFCVVITKDTRSTKACLVVQLVDGTPPSVYLECTASSVCTQTASGQVIPRSGRLGVKCECLDCLPTDQILYKWIFYTYDYRWPWKSIENISDPMYSVGVNSKELSVKIPLFNHFEGVSKFRAGCEATKQGQTTKGLAYMNFEINEAPSNGSCTISKTEGIVSVNKEFCIMCKDWHDAQGIAEYQLIVRYLNDDVDREVIALPVFEEPICIDLPMGADYNDFKEKVIVQIRDSLGAVTEYIIDDVTVRPLSAAESQQLIADFRNSDADQFDKIYAEGDTNSIAAITSNLVAILNSDSKADQSEYNGVGVASSKTNTGFGPSDGNRTGAFDETDSVSNPELNKIYEQEKDLRSQLKQQGVLALTSLTSASITSIKQIASGLTEFLHYPEEVTLKTAEASLEKTLDMAKYLSNMTGISYEDRKQTYIYMVGTVGAALDAIGFNGDNPSLTELAEAKESPEFEIYDTNWENTKGAIVAEDMDAARNVHSQHTHKNHAGEKSTEYIDKAVETVSLLTQGFSQNSVPGEEIDFVTNRIKGVIQNQDAKSMLGNTVEMKDSNSYLKIPNDINALFPGGNKNENDSLVLQFLQTASLPYKYSEHSDDLGPTTNGLVIDIFDENGNPQIIKDLATPFEFTIEKDKNSPPTEFKTADPFIVKWDYLYYHKMNISKKGASLHVQFNVQDISLKFLVLVRFGDFPSIPEKLFDFMGIIPDNSAVDPYRYTYFLDNKKINDYIGTVYIGVRQLDPSEYTANYQTALDLPNYEKGTGNPSEKYKIRVFSTGCYFFDKDINDWSSKGCWVGPKTDELVTHCFCNHLTTFAGGWVVVPNTIDWNFVFSNSDFSKNPTLYITEIVIAALYLIAVIWARREDKKDIERLGLTPLKDNDPRDKYYYEVCVVTGMRRNAGTDSKVCFILSGEYDETDVRMFSDDKRKIFRRGAVDAFLVAVPRPLGTLNYARVWHDNSGKTKMASWYLKYLLVRDVQTNQRFVFISNKWFAVEEDDGQVDRVIPVAGKEQMTEFGHLFAEKSRKSLVDGHLWFSVVARPANSRFTRVQRVSCCLLLLFVSMLGNAMFYGQDLSSSTAYNFGPFALSPEQIFIGIAVNLIVFPINFLVITLFRKSRARKMRPSRIDEALKRSGVTPTADKPSMEGVWTSQSPTMMDEKRAGTSASMRPETSFSSVSRMGTQQYEALRSEKKKKKKKFEFPWWCSILGWVVLWIGVGLSLAFVTFYGITFQDEKCKKWITSMLMSFFTSVFITQPVKVFLTAIFFSLVVKNPGEEEEDEVEDEESHKLASDEEFLHFEDGYGATRPRKIGYKPPDPAELEKARIQRLNEIKMWEIIREIVFYSFFLWILMVISYRNRSPHGFTYKNSLVKTFVDNNDTKQWFSKVRNTAEYWKWSQSGLLNGIRASNYYNSDPPLLLRGFVNDKVSRIMGYATMRQLRVKPGLCEIRGVMNGVIPECNEAYSFENQDEGTYLPRWQKLASGESYNDTSRPWRYTTANELNGYPYWGKHEMYSGGGYVVQLRGSKDSVRDVLKELEDDDWIDQYTRAVFVEFTIYNAQINLFAIATIVAEFDSAGGVTTSHRFEPALLLPYMSSVMLFQIACEVIYLIFTAWFIIRALKAFYKERFGYFTQFWNIIELGIISASLGAVIIYFYRLYVTNDLTAVFARSHGNEYMKFQYVGYWNEVFSYMIGWLVFFATLKFLKLLRFNKRMALVAATLKNGSKSLMHFGIIFLIVYMAFMQLFYLTFMNLSTAFQTFINSMESGVLMMMGKFDIYSMAMVEPVLTQIFVFFFVVTITFILVNMFLSILNETFGAVREDINKVNNDYEIVDFMVGRFKRWTGIGAAPANTLEPSNIGADGKPQDNVNNFPDRIDKLLTSISNIYMDEDGIAKRMNAKEQAANKANMKGMLRGSSSHSGLAEVDN